MTRFLLLEDNPWVRQSAVELIEAPSTGFSVVSSVESVEDALRAVASGIVFDAALVDLHLRDGSGITVIDAIRRASPAAVVVAFTVLEDAPTIFAALRAGARGYLLKSTAPARLVPLLKEALAGGAPMSPTVARLVVQSFGAPAAPLETVEPGTAGLTAREREVLTLIAKGVSYPEVGRMLGVALSTVQGHVKGIYTKLEVGSKAEAAVVASRMGLV